MKYFFKVFLKTLGIAMLVAGGLLVLIAFSFAPDDPERLFGLIGTFMFDAVLFGLGYLLLLWSQSIHDETYGPDVSGSGLHKLGVVLLLILIIELAICLPLIGRVIFAVLLLLIYARIDRDWSSKEVVGKTTYAEIFDFTIGGFFYLVVNVIFALLTGGRGGGSSGGGGGLSGGGGASGSW